MSELQEFRKKPVTVQAAQWNGDYPEDGTIGEGKVVRYYRNPYVRGTDHCSECGREFRVHGWIDTLEGGHIVCPCDWVITGVKGEHYQCKPDIFIATYEESTLFDARLEQVKREAKAEALREAAERVSQLRDVSCMARDSMTDRQDAMERDYQYFRESPVGWLLDRADKLEGENE